MASLHEGYAILKEEVDELWDEIKANRTGKSVRGEALQVAAVALRIAAIAHRQEVSTKPVSRPYEDDYNPFEDM